MLLNIQNFADVHCAIGVMKRIGITCITFDEKGVPTMVMPYEKAKQLFPNQEKWEHDGETVSQGIKFINYHVDDVGLKFVFCNLEFIGE